MSVLFIPYILGQYLIAILRDPYQMNLQIVNGMSCVVCFFGLIAKK